MAKFVLAVISTIILVAHMRRAVNAMTAMVAHATLPGGFRQMRVHLLAHAIGGLVVLVVITALSVYKPRGLTPYGRRT